MSRRISYTKPGAEKRGFVPDSVMAFEADGEHALLEFVLASLPSKKRTSIKGMLQRRQIAVNSTPVTRFDFPLKQGDKVEVNFTRPFVMLRNRRVKIVFEDADVIVVEKGYGLLSVGTGKPGEETAYGILKDYLKLKDPSNKIFVVHRLDRDTSGLMMFAKSIEAKEALQYNWNNMVLSRKYTAMVEGTPDSPEGTVKSYLTENSAFQVYSTGDNADGKLAVTRYRTLFSVGGYTNLEVEIDTGRKNQIRVHMKDLGHPIAGDRKYGAKSSPFRRLALHASSLRFVHPITRKDMNFTSKAPWL